jgi:hypothetical protein
MKRTNVYRHGSNALKVFDVYIAPLFLVGLGGVLIVFGFTISLPKAAELSEVRGHLESYYHKQTGRGRSDYTTIVILEEGGRFWTDAIDKDTAAEMFSRRGVELRFYIEPNSRNDPIDGAAKSYGLWVNGQEVKFLNATLEHEKFIVRFGFPALGIFIAAISAFIYRKRKAKYAL